MDELTKSDIKHSLKIVGVSILCYLPLLGVLSSNRWLLLIGLVWACMGWHMTVTMLMNKREEKRCY